MTMKLFVRSRAGVQAYTLCPEDTVASMRQKIGKDLDHEGPIKICFPGIGKEIRDHDALLSHFPTGVTVNVDLESDLDDDGNDTPGDGLSNDLKIGGNRAFKKALQSNLIFGVNQQARGRATKAYVVENEASESAKQSNAVLSGIESLRLFLNASAMKT
ncbi:hypothetical protein F4782DRAFT_484523 [Xylaria castorea]|nr:hypothetical protein F4782DRAFT_484523 [Xylaria castorea]